MENAFEELMNEFRLIDKTKSDVKCAVIGLSNGYPMADEPFMILDNPIKPNTNTRYFSTVVVLKDEWDNSDWEKFTKELNFSYDDDYGRQNLYGIVWFKDGSWLERYEYDGKEWWVLKHIPTVPDSLKGQLNGSSN